MEKNFQMLAKCFYGMESVLAEELKKLGAEEATEGNRLVKFKGDKAQLDYLKRKMNLLRERVDIGVLFEV